MNTKIIIGLLWVIGGILMLTKKSVSFGAVQIKMDCISLYLITASIIFIDISMIINHDK